MKLAERIIQLSDEIFPYARDIRRNLHIHPELSEQEENTMNLIISELDKLGIPYQKNVAGFGVYATIYGGKSPRPELPCVGIRADIDALPILEKAEVPWRSACDGVMHACGHDFHTAILLGTARLLMEIREELPGNVRLIFQPAEETIGGADRMIREGCLADPPVSDVIALHVSSGSPAGHVDIISGTMNAASSEFHVTVKGHSCHGAHPDTGIDPLLPACAMVLGLQSIITRRRDPADPELITVGNFHSGTAGNVIPGETRFNGIIRALEDDRLPALEDQIRVFCENTARAYGAECEIRFGAGYPTTVNDSELLTLFRNAASEIIPEENIHIHDHPSLGTDDFAYYTHAAKGLYYSLGTARPGDNDPAPLHSEFFDPDETAIPLGIATEVIAVLRILEKRLSAR